MAKKMVGYKPEVREETLVAINKFLQLGVIAPAGAVEYLQMKLSDIFDGAILYSEDDKGVDNGRPVS